MEFLKKNALPLFMVLIFISIIYYMTNKTIINIVEELPSNGDYSKRDLNNIQEITVHHTAVNRADYSPYDAASYHINNKGWPRIGYHFFISKKGRIFKTNNLDSISFHNGFSNSISIGVVLHGNFENEHPTKKQISSLKYLVKKINSTLGIKASLICHKDYPNSSTACCGRNLIPFVRGIQKDLKLANEYTSISMSAVKASIRASYNPQEADN